ncbi:phosphatidic acid phosphatase type 2/haloperoxidase [Dipodascopsis uninucleata]
MLRYRASNARILVSYVIDYALLVILLAIWGWISTLPPRHSRFSLTDITLQYPMADPETISFENACLLSILLPVLVFILWSLLIDFYRYRSKVAERLWDLNCAILGLALSVTVSIVIVTSLKQIVGRPRPDSISRCKPEAGAHDASPYGLSSIEICTQTDKSILDEGFRSWPSGHSSTAFAGLFYLSLYLAGKLSLFDNKGEVWKTVIVISPSLGAAAIACTRILDHRHHGSDAVTGSLMGAGCAWMAYRLYFPSLSDTERQGQAWSLRSWGESLRSKSRDSTLDDTLTGGLPDDEERIDLASKNQFRRRQRLADDSPYAPENPYQSTYDGVEYELNILNDR